MRQAGQYVESGGNEYAAAQMQQRMSGQRIEHKASNYQGQGRADHFNSENDKSSYGPSKGEGQWRWDRDESSHMFSEGQGGDASRSYYQSQGHGHGHGHGQRSDDKQRNNIRSQAREEDMELGYEDNFAGHTFEALEQRFYDDIYKLTKEQNDAEDAENARHRERVNAINAQYEEQLGALRARHTNRRDELLRRDSHERQQQYANSGMGIGGFTDPHHHGYNVDSYRDRPPRFTRDSQDPAFEPQGGPYPPPGGRIYGSASRYY